MKTVFKALTAVVRTRHETSEVLVFKHPHAGVQIPKGTVENNETIAEAAIRELKEESGIELTTEPKFIGTWERIVGGGPNEDGPLEINIWSIHIAYSDSDFPEQWKHKVEGGEEELGLVFEFFWLPVDLSLPDKLEPDFRLVAEAIVDHMTT